MIDIHTHILPNIDDGSTNMEQSLLLAQKAVSEGISTVIATPHHANGVYCNEANDVRSATDNLQLELNKNNIPLTVRSGQEIRIYDKLLGDFESGKLLTLADTSFMLLEFPSSGVPRNTGNLIHELSILHITPVIAHPERNRELANDMDRLWELVRLGAVAQVTAHSINGLFGKKVQETALEMCQRNLVHFIASDVHNMGPRDYAMREAFDRISSRIGSQYSEYFRNNACQLLGYGDFEVWKPEKAGKSFNLFFKKI